MIVKAAGRVLGDSRLSNSHIYTYMVVALPGGVLFDTTTRGLSSMRFLFT